MLVYFTNKETVHRIFSQEIELHSDFANKTKLHYIFSRKATFQCSWCGRWELNGQFLNVNELPSDTEIDENPSSGICPDCKNKHVDVYKKEITNLNKTNPLA
jgi:Zn finger protein HypA/HybF involved in hydrogenase expression